MNQVPRLKNVPPPGKKLIGDWRNMRVKTLRSMRNGAAELPAGTIATVMSTSTTGFTLHTDKCKCCGVVVIISRISSHDVEPLE